MDDSVIPWKDVIYLSVICGMVYLWNQIPHHFVVDGDLRAITSKCAFGELQGTEKTKWRFDKDMNLIGIDVKCKEDPTIYKM